MEDNPLLRAGRIYCEWYGGYPKLSLCKRECKLFNSALVCPRRATFEEWMYHELTGEWLLICEPKKKCKIKLSTRST